MRLTGLSRLFYQTIRFGNTCADSLLIKQQKQRKAYKKIKTNKIIDAILMRDFLTALR